MTYKQVALHGFSEKVGLSSFSQKDNKMTKPYDSKTGCIIDAEVREWMRKAYDRTVLPVMEEHRVQVGHNIELYIVGEGDLTARRLN
ncbi:Atp-dependent zinc metalloprotease ftsh 3 protein [Thalictrum thalictroides]|uniref:Atp-dependent zinc metalloprotease ftsh 3 protein n=1 Tax=Thalictrum thalictroides TaxID=46969 RepID=A0A7J6VX66_THATH|nr:Atp-dependent zinc metalloprotease ftsh 3 protein [Thalictrum thalictroides]